MMPRPKKKQAAAPLFVLTLHGVVARVPEYANCAATRPFLLKVEDFERIVRYCAGRYHLARIADIPAYASGEASRAGILFTFDDGLASACERAVPVLRRYGATAVMFVTEEWIDEGITPPVFELERELWMRAPVDLTIETQGFRCHLPQITRHGAGAAVESLWAALMEQRLPPLSLRRDAFRFDDQRWGVSKGVADKDFWHPTTWSALRDAVDDGTLEIGVHGASHDPWPWLGEAALQTQLGASRERLEREFQRPVESCAYPHGLIDAVSMTAVRTAFRWGFGSAAGAVTESSDPANLPRFCVPAEYPNSLPSIVEWPLLGRALRKGVRVLRKLA